MARQRPQDQNLRGNKKAASQPSRRQRFRARQRSVWMTFVGKVSLFLLPVIFLSWWLIMTVLSQGNQLDILVLDIAVDSEAADLPFKRSPLSVRSYGRKGKNKAGFIRLPEEIHFGGPDKDAIIVFNDLLGSAREINGETLPCIFIPANEQEHLTHAFYGVPDEETAQHHKQWRTFDEFVRDMVSQLVQQVRDNKKAILVFDIDHPDFAGKLPPQVNPFIALCQRMWDDSLKETLAKEFEGQLEVHIWLSHSDGQKSYLDSNPNETESIFKQRFELGISGDIFNWIRKNRGDRRNVRYSDLKNYLNDYVVKDAKLHNLVQMPVCLEPESFEDFRLLRYQSKTDSKLGTVFRYPRRRNEPRLDELWRKFDEAKRRYHWTLENPIATQQANVLLLQLERLWYEGKSQTDLFEQFAGKLERLFDARVTISPVVHSLRDAEATLLRRASRPGKVALPKFPPEWLVPIQVDSAATDQQREKAREQLDARDREIKKWCDKNSGVTAGLSVWQDFLGRVDQESELKPLIQQVFQVLKMPSQRKPDQNGTLQIEFNEFVYLRRILEELTWISDSSNKQLFGRTVVFSLKTRDASNRYVANLAPMLVQQFEVEFEKLESERRRLEDRLFAHDGIGQDLAKDFGNLLKSYERIDVDRQHFERQLRAAQQKLVNSNHGLRYAVENAASSSIERDANWLNQFEETVDELVQSDVTRFRDSTPLSSVLFETELLKLESVFDLAGLEVADGNLNGRRLLFWPLLDLSKRQELRKGLAKDRIEKDDRKLDQLSNDVHDGLTEAELVILRNQVDSNLANKVSFLDDKETELLRAARISHRQPLYSEKKTGVEQDLTSFINRFHSKKSDFDFRRVANDLWGTQVNKQGAGTTFVEIATARHRDTILERLDNLRELRNRELQKLRAKMASSWEKNLKQEWKWQERITEIETFVARFGYWRREGSALERSIPGQPFEKELDRQSETDRNRNFIVTLESNTRGKVRTRKSAILTAEKDAKIELPDDLVRFGRPIKVYFRGHSCRVDLDAKTEVVAQNVVTKFIFDEGIRGTRLEIDRAIKESDNPTIGEVYILLDCSGSMNGVRLKNVKQYVISFLESAAKRKDIKVSIFAFGASFYTDAKGNFKPKEDVSNLLKYKRVNDSDDVWRYPKGKAELLEPATLGGFLKAVENLQAYGETPIVAALDLALPDKHAQPRLAVLLTDGFEYTKEPGDAEHRPFTPGNRRLKKVKQKLADTLSTLVIFNMVSSSDKNAFANFGGIDYANRIRLINGLSEHRKSADGGKLELLKRFLQGVLPKPRVSRTPEFVNEVSAEQDDDGIGLRQTIQLGPNDRPENWELLLKFEPEKSIRAFQKVPVDWKANSRNFGNEVLAFKYDPFRESFYLVTDWGMPRKDDQEMRVKNGLKIGVRDASARDKPLVSVASLDGKELTPAPGLVWLELLGPNAESLVVQDFFLRRQGPGRSNVHSILFPQIQSVLKNRILVKTDSKLNMNFVWIDEFKRNAWTMLDVSKIDTENPVVRIGTTTQKVKERDDVEINDALVGDEFRDYEFYMSRTNLSPDRFSLKLTISSQSGKQLDRWLVQLLNKKGNEPHRTCRRVTHRSYGIDESGKLQSVTHEFVIDRTDFKSGATVGIAHLDEMKKAYVDLPSVSFVDAFKSMD